VGGLAVVVALAAAPFALGKDEPGQPHCRQRLAALETRLRQAEGHPDPSPLLPTSDHFQAPRGAGAETTDGLTLIVERGLSETRIDGRPAEAVKDPAALAAAVVRQIEAAQSRWRLLHADQQPPPPRLGLWIDGRFRASDGLALLAALDPKLETSLLLVREPPRQPAELPPHVSQRLESIRATTDPARKSQMIADSVRDALAGCSARRRLPPDLDGTGPGRQRRIHRALVAAVAACSCVGVDVDMLEALAVAGGEVPQVQVRPLRLGGPSATTVTLPPAATFQELLGRLPPAPAPVGVRWRAEGTPAPAPPPRSP
jgi:hypothetical protein